MKLLVDTHIILWAVSMRGEPDPHSRLSRIAALINDPANDLFFSVVTIWEVAIKSAAGRGDFAYSAPTLRTALLDAGYTELPIRSDHALRLADLPPIHRDPFDRILAAQALAENMALVTADKNLALYPCQIVRI